MSKNIMLPLSLLERVIDLLECLEVSKLHELHYDYCDILWTLKVKMQKLELRKAYAQIIQATDEDAQNEARIKYLWQKSQIGSEYSGDLDF